MRHEDFPANRLVLWEPNQGRASRGVQMLTYNDSLKRDAGLASSEELEACMLDRSVRLDIVTREDSK